MYNNIPFCLNVSLDIIARHRASDEQLSKICDGIFRARRVGSRDRTPVRSMVYGWARSRVLFETEMEAAIATGGMPPQRRERDLAIIYLALGNALPRDSLIALKSPFLQNFVQDRQGQDESLDPLRSLPAWFAEEICKQYGDNASALARSLNQPASLVLAVDQRVITSKEASRLLLEHSIETAISDIYENALVVLSGNFSFGNLSGVLKDALWPMDEGSQFAASIIACGPNDSVLDLCAGKGNKTRFLLQSGAYVTAMDVSEERINMLTQRTGMERANCVVGDATTIKLPENSFDWILIDAPCSGTGTLRRAPDLFSRMSLAQVEQFALIQRELILNAAKFLKANGKLVYVTCSVLAQENEQVIEGVLKESQELTVYSFTKEKESNMQLLPYVDGCDGFFIAAFTPYHSIAAT